MNSYSDAAVNSLLQSLYQGGKPYHTDSYGSSLSDKHLCTYSVTIAFIY